ncbi:hypothetical protein [Treponema sp.]|uniref:hypothetical protein n=1 Tax=Treponema sp. TaxID=166 RepID=UPI0025F5EA9C|nr:hypothetical protein [Treponema sp.]MBR4321591.1 hypothetical protein [Treponema sp.]
MKITKQAFALFSLLAAASLLFSCASAGNLDDSSSLSKSAKSADSADGTVANGGKSSSEKLPPPPARLTEAPVFDFAGETIKIEAENMYYDGFELTGDFKASACYAIKLLNDSSWAIAEINFPAGTYEALANVLAPDSTHSRFNVYINKDSYLVYGSEPPIGKYELTTRSPASFTLDQPARVTLKIQQNDIRNPANNGQNGMTIDYVTFKKIK